MHQNRTRKPIRRAILFGTTPFQDCPAWGLLGHRETIKSGVISGRSFSTFYQFRLVINHQHRYFPSGRCSGSVWWFPTSVPVFRSAWSFSETIQFVFHIIYLRYLSNTEMRSENSWNGSFGGHMGRLNRDVAAENPCKLSQNVITHIYHDLSTINHRTCVPLWWLFPSNNSVNTTWLSWP